MALIPATPSRARTPQGRPSVGAFRCRTPAARSTFHTIYPGWYPGRITHIHFEVFLDNGLVATSQIAFPPEITDAVYAVEPYAAKGPNTSVPTFADDMVFSDGTQYQLASVTGDPTSGLAATLLVGVAA